MPAGQQPSGAMWLWPLLWVERKRENRNERPLGRVCFLRLGAWSAELGSRWWEESVTQALRLLPLPPSLAHTSCAPQLSCFLPQVTPRLVLPHGVALSATVDTVSAVQLTVTAREWPHTLVAGTVLVCAFCGVFPICVLLWAQIYSHPRSRLEIRGGGLWNHTAQGHADLQHFLAL